MNRNITLIRVLFTLFLVLGSIWVMVPAKAVSLVSSDSSGIIGNNNSLVTATAGDARYVVFESFATNLTAITTNAARDIFLKDTLTGEVTCISCDALGNEGNVDSLDPSVSSDGQFAVFTSNSNNLAAGDTNGFTDVFLKNTSTGELALLSWDSLGNASNGQSSEADISADGKYIVYSSDASDLIGTDSNGFSDIFLENLNSGNRMKISTGLNGAQSNGFSFKPSISANGRYVVFHSSASNLVANDTNAVTDIFRYDIETNSIDIISTDNDGIGGNNISLRAVISADGRYVAFESAASNLVAGDINGTRDIFIKDTFTRNTTRVNADVACDVSVGCRISINDDGRYVVFNSNVPTLVTGDTNAAYDVFVADMVTGNIARASIDVFGNEGNNTSIGPDISDDGSAIVFYSIANNLITGDTNGFADVFRTENPLYVPDTDGDKLWDDIELLLGTNPNLVDSDNDGLSDYNEVHRDFDASDYLPGVDTDPANSDTDGDLLIDGQEVGLGLNPHIADPGLPTVLRISLSGSGGEVSRHYLFSSISHDGRYVAFDSAASNLVDGDTNITEDVFLKDIEFGVLTRVSTDASGNEGGYNLRSINPSITADGLQVAFTSGAILTAGGSDSGDVYIKQVQTGNISIVSANASGVASNDTSYAQDISNDGQYLVFQSRANNLVPEDTSAPFQFDIFIKDVVSGAITRLSADENGNDANGNSESARISPDGRYVVFDSFASNLVTGDVNGTADIFMSDTQTGNTTLVSTNSAGSQAATGSSHLPDISINGRYVVFVSTATDLVSGDPDTFFDVFLKDNKTGITSQLSTGDPASEDNDNDASVSPRISDDGRYAVFASLASDVVPGDTNSAMDIFVSETQTGNVARVSTDALGNEGNFGSTNPVISGDGRYITFVSGSSNLVANDTNEDVDFFRVENPLYTPDSDTDGDSVMDSIDNCPLIHNPAQTDTDSNWTGDACQLSITGVWPASATVGEGLSVFIFGENFTTDNTTEVYFNGIRQFLVAPVSTDMLIVRIPSVTSSLFGPVTVTTPSDSTTSTQIFGSPVSGLNLTGVWPGAPKIGEFTSIFLFGTEFTTDNSTEVYFNGIRQFLVAPVSNEMLIVRVLGNASLSGTVTVVTPTGVVNSVDPLIFVP